MGLGDLQHISNRVRVWLEEVIDRLPVTLEEVPRELWNDLGIVATDLAVWHVPQELEEKGVVKVRWATY